MINWVLVSPLFVGIALALALHLGWRRWPAWLRRVGLTALVACYLLLTPLVAEPLTALLEKTADAPCTTAPQAIVVLSGGADEATAPDDFAALNAASLRRLMGGVALWHRQPPDTLLVLAGGSGTKAQAESPLMAALAERLGVPAAVIRNERHSTTTWENAHELARLQPAVPRQVWLVTSALHMRRARYSMQRAGFEVCNVPVDYRQHPITWSVALLPSADALGKTNAALHELAGMLWYRLKH